MPRYFFSVANSRPYKDIDGLELKNLEDARSEAKGFANDLMRLEPERSDWSGWSVRVTNEIGVEVLFVPFERER